MDFESEEYETVLYVARECYVYKIPPRSSTAGYRAAEWGDMEAFLWKGRLRIIEHGQKCSIRLEDGNSGELFALCPYDISGQSVESVLDSSRYFVLRVESEDAQASSDTTKKKRAFIGMGFQDRSESFDFNVALQDWTKRAKAAKEAKDKPQSSSSAEGDLVGTTNEPSPHIPAGPKQDYSLKEGQTFSIQIPGSHAGRKIRDQTNSGSSGLSGFGGGSLLPPPPSKRN
ncbi:adaptin ear-binding coat-associated protein 1 NECAP-1 [Meira miltonrushii]|uniref:Adaptin ear-binding coat-associated protein 1 NECAP-1 n=1 Tax=Meira miltonrushii TaxID=1280837 RepID=A0A316VK29_9BASI|nr:adaptin ear-binding coat-associated protein 1 NECAP-1 [Meira miltonrushii]PWN37584.1 adaptin ear-binding coat-associated protein 1 NECAP-1 [Meira miltonrushii]